MSEETKCASCGILVDLDGNFCYGCKEIICVECAQKYDHFGNGKHTVPNKPEFRCFPDLEGMEWDEEKQEWHLLTKQSEPS